MTERLSPMARGIRLGLGVGATAMAYAVIVSVLSRGEVLRRNHTSLLALLLVYGLGGAAAGAIAGALHSVGRSLPGAMLVGALAAFPAACLVWLSLALQSHAMALNGNTFEVLGCFALISAAVAGPIYGAAFWYGMRSRDLD